MNYNYTLLKINHISGGLYTNKSHTKNKTIVVYGIGAPIVPDNGLLPDAPIIMQHNVDLFVPDYIGYGRSDGQFTPMNCIQTFLDLYDNLYHGCIGKNSYENVVKILQYERIIFIGRSLGGTYIPLLPRFNKNIKEVAIFCPVVDSKSCGSIAGEESNEDFLRSMQQDGYHHLYRGILEPQWKDHLENKDDLSPMENISHLKDARLFIAHGKKDVCVNYSKSVRYYQEIKKYFPEKDDVILSLYDGDHGPSTTNKAAEDFLKWIL